MKLSAERSCSVLSLATATSASASRAHRERCSAQSSGARGKKSTEGHPARGKRLAQRAPFLWLLGVCRETLTPKEERRVGQGVTHQSLVFRGFLQKTVYPGGRQQVWSNWLRGLGDPEMGPDPPPPSSGPSSRCVKQDTWARRRQVLNSMLIF